MDILGYITGYQLTPPGNAAPDDGRDGTKTQQAIMNVQADSNISIDGTVGSQTRNQLTTKVGE
jgi:peptidoglycan hydrolase-like protein with peptidoglycan-binding domain